MKITILGSTDVGQKRQHNEDTIYVDPKFRFAIVCDGIGGNAGGKVASQVAVENIKSYLSKWFSEKSKVPPQTILQKALEKANTAIREKGEQVPELKDMGTTVECALIHNKSLHLAHLGDSRTYLFDSKQLLQTTIDHNVKELVRTGELPKQTLNVYSGNTLIRALGISKSIEANFFQFTLDAKHLFLICSDGLSDMLSEQKIKELLTANLQNLEQLPHIFIKEANLKGGIDNISIVLIYMS